MITRRECFTKGALTFLAAATYNNTPLAYGDVYRLSGNTLFPYAVNAETFWTNIPFHQRLELIADAGFSCFEFWLLENKKIDAVIDVCHRRGLKAIQFTAARAINGASQRTEFLADLEWILPVAKHLGVRMLTVAGGRMVEGVDMEQQTEEVIRSLSEAAPVVKEADVTLLLEPLNTIVDHPGQLVSRLDHAVQIINAVESTSVKLLFDIYHQQITEGYLSGNISRYHNLTGYYQIADYPGRHEPGTGEINIPHILRTIYAEGYRGPVGLEFIPTGDPLQALQAVLEADKIARGV